MHKVKRRLAIVVAGLLAGSGAWTLSASPARADGVDLSFLCILGGVQYGNLTASVQQTCIEVLSCDWCPGVSVPPNKSLALVSQLWG